MARRASRARNSKRGVYRAPMPPMALRRGKSRLLPTKAAAAPPTGYRGWGIRL